MFLTKVYDLFGSNFILVEELFDGDTFISDGPKKQNKESSTNNNEKCLDFMGIPEHHVLCISLLLSGTILTALRHIK